jgi:hypothetical protein
LKLDDDDDNLDIEERFSNEEEIVENHNEIFRKKPHTVLGIKGGASIRT